MTSLFGQAVKTTRYATVLLVMVLAACGRENTGANAPAASAPPLAQVYTASDYANVVQGLYISYFGRPADTGGLQNFQTQLMTLNIPADIGQLDQQYHGNAAFKTLIDSFSISPESAALYSGDNTAFITAIFKNVLNRKPNPEGLAFWIKALDSGSVTRSNAALAIMAAALTNTTEQGKADKAVLNNKIKIGNNFTEALLNAPADGYAGKAAAAKARTMLASVDASTDATAFQGTVNKLVSDLAPAK
ncbi:MAG: DUF4214 domain-containing protein [Pseudomonadota bacterium]